MMMSLQTPTDNFVVSPTESYNRQLAIEVTSNDLFQISGLTLDNINLLIASSQSVISDNVDPDYTGAEIVST